MQGPDNEAPTPHRPDHPEPSPYELETGATPADADPRWVEFQRFEARTFSGPLPHPAILRGYEDALPGCAERIVSMVEEQSVHRQRLESRVVESDIKSKRLGQIFAFIISLLIIGAGVFLIYNDKSGYGFALILLQLAGVAGAFLYSQRRQNQELREKQEALPQPGTSNNEGTPPR